MLSLLHRSCSAAQIPTRWSQSSFISRGHNSTSKCSVPQLPKKPSSSSYVRYIESEYGTFVKKHPDLNSKEVIKGLSLQWQSLAPEAKQEYADSQRETYEDRKKEYERAHANFMASLTEEQKRAMDSRIQQRRIARFKRAVQSIEDALEKPKRVPSATALYLQSIAELNPNSKTILSDVVSQWNELSSDEKKKFHDMRSEKMKEYQTKLELYGQRLQEDEGSRRKLDKLRTKVAELQRTKQLDDE